MHADRQRNFSPVTLAGFELSNPVMSAAGTVKTYEEVQAAAQSLASGIVIGSMTLEERSGNAGTTYYSAPDNSLTANFKGMRNGGRPYYEKYLDQMVKITHDAGKILILSVAGFSALEYAMLAAFAKEHGVDITQLNLSCPNVVGLDGKPKPVTSFRPELVGDALYQVEREVGSDGVIDAKLSPFTDTEKLLAIAAILSESKVVKIVTSSNTIPKGLVLNDQQQSVIDSPDGLAGIGGKILKPLALGNVTQLRAALPAEVDVVGVGGIDSAADVRDYLSQGAIAVGLASAYFQHGPAIFEKIIYKD